ncbi:rapid response to glucose protein [Paracoccidioides lutzii Pb01]|uniref:Rapid response to glucose protein n=1 Tax=Paracoccidioides lutzii (strain ATCC MYA-826 / Pb01) TaxID=502779 RepID=C1HCQ7_PARBA|nr:rapid response to glucose protein [Paracoccidioides lutzii Pb01]EEH38821.1 rapid response to glucose protein [Paracoccidioides lutzii Pb01]
MSRIYPVFDLPQLYTKPAATDILRALEQLAVRPRSFDNDIKDGQPTVLQAGVSQYLTSIIASALSWIESDKLREAIWDAASARLCERSGRTAMPAISRVFTIPTTQDTTFQLTLHEPSLTSDNLGMKTWVSSYLLAKRLHTLIPPSFLNSSRQKNNRPLRALELGAGTGLVGLSFAAICGSLALIHLTDLDAIVPNLAHNVELNKELLDSTGATATTGVLDWSLEMDLRSEPSDSERYDAILAADPLYSSDHPQWLVQTIRRRLHPGSGSRAVVEMPLRDAYLPQVEDFRRRMDAVGLAAVKEGEEIGYDDWEKMDGEALEVRCWWAVWGWREEGIQ